MPRDLSSVSIFSIDFARCMIRPFALTASTFEADVIAAVVEGVHVLVGINRRHNLVAVSVLSLEQPAVFVDQTFGRDLGEIAAQRAAIGARVDELASSFLSDRSRSLSASVYGSGRDSASRSIALSALPVRSVRAATSSGGKRRRFRLHLWRRRVLALILRRSD
jgi:hypothetical protein